jgi:hypothetical protein
MDSKRLSGLNVRNHPAVTKRPHNNSVPEDDGVDRRRVRCVTQPSKEHARVQAVERWFHFFFFFFLNSWRKSIDNAIPMFGFRGRYRGVSPVLSLRYEIHIFRFKRSYEQNVVTR